MDLYQELILEHSKRPQHAGLREPFEAEVHHVNPTCGDEVTMRLHVVGDGDDAIVEDVSYDALGCSISQAATSVAHDLLVGHTVGEAFETLEAYQAMVQSRGKVEPDEDVLDDAVAFAGVAAYPARVKCALLGWLAFKDAVAQAQASQAQASAQTGGTA